MNSKADSHLQLVELYTTGQISERTLNNLFRSEFGLTTMAYVNGQRLFSVHRELWRASSSMAGVTDC